MKCWDQDSQAVSVHLPRIMIAAEKSGGGKTLFTCALLSLLKERVQAVRAIKCGPDYIDPMFHRTVLEIPSRNLDSFFADGDTLRYLLGREVLEMKKIPESRIAVLEGVMGFYDGLGGVSERSSAWEVADLTDTPVILLVDMKGRSLSALASIKGFLDYKEKSHVTGVVFNRLSPMLYPGLKERAERELGIRVFGYVPELKNMTLESRHLGLVMPEEILGIRERLDLIKEKVRVGINLDGIIEEAGRAAEIEVKLPEAVRQFCNVDCGTGIKKTVVAVAKDEAFCFYYEDNLDILRKLGAEIQYFSPIHDRNLPVETCAVYLGGGYPELHAKALSENISMRNAIRQAVAEEMPCIAECGGYLYLKDSIVDPDGVEFGQWQVCCRAAAVTRGSLVDLGILLLPQRRGLLGPAGTEFAPMSSTTGIRRSRTDFAAKKPVGTRGWDCGYTARRAFMQAFPHLYFYSNVKIAENFIKCAETWKRKIPSAEAGLEWILHVTMKY